MTIETRNLPLTGAGDATATVAVDVTPEGDVQVVKLALSEDGSSVLIPADINGIVIQPRLDDPQTQQLIATAVAPGVNVDLNATDIPLGKTGKLVGADVGSSCPFRWDLQTVSGGRVTRVTLYTSDGKSEPWRPPFFSPKFIELVGGVGIHFGASVTNLSVGDTADARITLYWDEVS